MVHENSGFAARNAEVRRSIPFSTISHHSNLARSLDPLLRSRDFINLVFQSRQLREYS